MRHQVFPYVQHHVGVFEDDQRHDGRAGADEFAPLGVDHGDLAGFGGREPGVL